MRHNVDVVTQSLLNHISITPHTPKSKPTSHAPPQHLYPHSWATTHTNLILNPNLNQYITNPKQLGDDPQYTVQRILHEYKLHNCEILLREDVTTVGKAVCCAVQGYLGVGMGSVGRLVLDLGSWFDRASELYHHTTDDDDPRHDQRQDEVIDVIEGNRKYIRCLYAYNKIDTITIEEVG